MGLCFVTLFCVPIVKVDYLALAARVTAKQALNSMLWRCDVFIWFTDRRFLAGALVVSRWEAYVSDSA